MHTIKAIEKVSYKKNSMDLWISNLGFFCIKLFNSTFDALLKAPRPTQQLKLSPDVHAFSQHPGRMG